ncbi:bifunctional hydroxymethylpyrimidine kinase/phosphomethylpyrimidine kinase [Hyphomicrobium methylovorum]|uniref:bifunctional hydroxymethylpyrimidine kinase/phosphomethylpyrimidine kinase n=1 Tax=Hyphomicrobium methylovorum TaxID=84 RepID=UPI0015E6373E|nr:bifunctional hydroxymethylpyrimidine kinase/phosphomethylpyrimidine kinase [Hyphomicrobium methylovorum]MBA2124626.1 bifunctional hydroxymethylpyrimidine kinase/phosphomethylpyrimidine kinase [Hyphomicrobium methylovorum]
MTIAGSDPSGGAGIQADLKTFSAFGVYGASVITALTAQNTRGVTGIFSIPVEFIADQFHAVVSDLSVSAIKTGMLGDAATVEAVARLLGEKPGLPVIVDPVMVATSGDVLLPPSAVEAVRTVLIPRATLITPNIPEAATLLGCSPATSTEEMREQAEKLMQLGCAAILLKGGHAIGDEAIDVFFDGSDHHILTRPRVETSNTHGTGCTLSAAIAAGIAMGREPYDAVSDAKSFVWNALVSGAERKIGHGHGPLDHHFASRK